MAFKMLLGGMLRSCQKMTRIRTGSLCDQQGHITVLITGIGSRRMINTRVLSEAREMLGQYPGGSVDLTTDDDTGIATIILNNPEIKNAFTGKMMVDLEEAVAELEKWKQGKGLILAGAGNTFCSGGDLAFMEEVANPKDGAKLCAFMQSTLTRMWTLPLVSVALLQGQVLGGGAELATATDFRVTTEQVSIGFIQARLGVSTGWGGATRLVQLVGRTTALKLLCSAKLFSWKEAIEIGLCDSVIQEDGDNSLDLTKDWLKKHVRGVPLVSQSIKTAIVEVSKPNWDEVLEAERNMFVRVWGGPAHIEAMEKNMKHIK